MPLVRNVVQHRAKVGLTAAFGKLGREFVEALTVGLGHTLTHDLAKGVGVASAASPEGEPHTDASSDGREQDDEADDGDNHSRHTGAPLRPRSSAGSLPCTCDSSEG